MNSESFFGHYVIKIFSRDFFAVLSGSFQHFSQFVIAHGLSQLLRYFPQVRQVDGIAAIFIEKVEYFVNAFFGFLIYVIKRKSEF
jgi:hypothetical protein